MALKRWFALLGVAVALVAQDAHAQGTPSQGTPVVYVRGQALLQAAPGAAEAARTFERELADMRTELQRQAAVVDSMLQDYQRQEVLLSPQAKEQKQGEIMNLRNRLQQRQGEMDAQAQQRQQELLGPILERVGDVIEQIRSANGYSIVLDASKEGLVAADTTLDITNAILSRLGVTAPPPAADGGVAPTVGGTVGRGRWTTPSAAPSGTRSSRARG